MNQELLIILIIVIVAFYLLQPREHFVSLPMCPKGYNLSLDQKTCTSTVSPFTPCPQGLKIAGNALGDNANIDITYDAIINKCNGSYTRKIANPGQIPIKYNDPSDSRAKCDKNLPSCRINFEGITSAPV